MTHQKSENLSNRLVVKLGVICLWTVLKKTTKLKSLHSYARAYSCRSY